MGQNFLIKIMLLRVNRLYFIVVRTVIYNLLIESIKTSLMKYMMINLYNTEIYLEIDNNNPVINRDFYLIRK